MLEGEESEEHLFHECVFTKEVWGILRRRVGYTTSSARSWQEELDWIKVKMKGEGVQQWGRKLVLAPVVYWVWRERNQRIFHNKQTDANVITMLVWNDAQIKLGSLNIRIQDQCFRDEMQDHWGIDIQYCSSVKQKVRRNKQGVLNSTLIDR